MEKINNHLKIDFVRHIYKKLREKLSGSAADRVYGDKPQIQFFVGTLCSRDPTKSPGSIQTKVSPINIGAEFLMRKNDLEKSKLEIVPRGSVFYKVNPTYEEQIKDLLNKKGMEKEDILEKAKLKDGDYIDMRPLNVFKKIKLKDVKLLCPLDCFAKSDFHGEKTIEEAKEIVEDTLNNYNLDDNVYRPKQLKKDEIKSTLPYSALKDEESFQKYLEERGSLKDLIPSWDFKIVVSCSEFDNAHVKIVVVFENTSVAKENDHIDNSIFDASLDIRVDGAEIQNFIIDYLDDHYKYDGNIEASGINCEARKIPGENRIITESMPCFEQYRIKTNNFVNASFNELASDNSLDTLNKIKESMEDYLHTYDIMEKSMKFKSEEGKRKFNQDRESFKNEIQRFQRGIEILKKFPLALSAFKHMNKTFSMANESKACEKNYTSWRLFQIIFIVMNIPDIISTEYPEIDSTFENVEVIYFPTGGGKTETYLGLSIFTLFFDRLRGKKFGVSVMTKFPLRLLSLQQIQRIANILAQAELLRRTDTRINGEGYEEFSLGYFVGDANTPNELIKKDFFGTEEKNLLSPIIAEREKILNGEFNLNDESLEGRKYLIISKCPFCGSKEIMIDADLEKIRLMHRCMNKECKEDIIPVYISDKEIYRYVPSFIVSTLDKIAICGLQKNFRNLFGQVTHKCPLHGYSSSPECTEKYICKVDKKEIKSIQSYDPVPTIQIQDEMHLIRESLGTFDSHYESFLEQFEKELTNGRRSMKIITATATISDYKMQTDHLYCRNSVMFPSQGPSIIESFYAKIDKEDLNRITIGISPHNTTMIYTVVTILEKYHELIASYYKNPKTLIEEMNLDLKESDIKNMLEEYKVKLSYHLAKSDGDSISNSIRTMVNRNLIGKGIKDITQHPLTGEVSFNDVRIVLDKIENPPIEGGIDLIIATNMISHGVDIDKLNFMTFMGMPTNTAEYIQASSRIGRASPGISIVIFNATRERDQSYFKFFTKFHEYRDLLIEAVPINRWAKFGIDRTLPGIFSAAIMNYFDLKTIPILKKSINMSKMFEKAIDEGLISEKQIIEFLEKSYKVEKDNMGFGFNKTIEEKVKLYVELIKGELGNNFINNVMPVKPMRSLRDVDKLIPINLSDEGNTILRNIKAARTSYYEDIPDEEDS